MKIDEVSIAEPESGGSVVLLARGEKYRVNFRTYRRWLKTPGRTVRLDSNALYLVGREKTLLIPIDPNLPSAPFPRFSRTVSEIGVDRVSRRTMMSTPENNAYLTDYRGARLTR